MTTDYDVLMTPLSLVDISGTGDYFRHSHEDTLIRAGSVQSLVSRSVWEDCGMRGLIGGTMGTNWGENKGTEEASGVYCGQSSPSRSNPFNCPTCYDTAVKSSKVAL